MRRTFSVAHGLVLCTTIVASFGCTKGTEGYGATVWWAPPSVGSGSAPASDDGDTDANAETDNGAGTQDGTSGAEGTTGNNGDGAPGGDPSSPTATSGAATSGDSILDACLDVAADACEECGCNSCLDPLYACEDDIGCVAMRECAQQSGCTDTLSCYEACQGVIDEHGGALGSSAELAGALSECMEASCAVCF